MGKQFQQLHVFFFPAMAHGHMIPMMDMARLFAERGVVVGIITTPGNASVFQKTIDRATISGHQIKLHLLQFPSSEAGLPEGCENMDYVSSPAMIGRFLNALYKLQQPTERLVEEHRPNCIVSDIFLPWTVDVAHKYKIPRLVFSGSSLFSSCAFATIYRHAPQRHVASDKEVFILPDLPHRVEMMKSQLPKYVEDENDLTKFMLAAKQADARSYGAVVNSFYELEAGYVDYYKEEIGSKVWHIGPLSLCNRNLIDKAQRGKKATIDEDECLEWLDSKKPSSVIYICFGSDCRHADRQLLEIAFALEASGHSFIWVVRNQQSEAWLPEGFEERMEGKGLVVRGWAPQILILSHPSIGTFMTHCGWNSTLEGVTAGVPMITWPVRAEQFFNEMLITQVSKIGVGVGASQWAEWQDEKIPLVKRRDIEKAIRRVMDGGDAADAMKVRARWFGEVAKRAAEKGGSSYVQVTDVMEELKRLANTTAY